MEPVQPCGPYQEIDVYVANDVPLSVLQFPLRPASRPYELETVKTVRFKPIAKRLEVDVPLDTKGSNYTTDQPDHRQINHITLRSLVTETKTNYAVGTFTDGKLVLVPVDDCLQLRPRLTYLDVEKRKEEDSDEDDEGQQEGQRSDLTAVEVQVRKRETERQQQARLNSYAYLAEREDEEQWQELKLHPGESALAAGLIKKLAGVASRETSEAALVPLDPAAYLAAIVPPLASVSSRGLDSFAASTHGPAEQERLTEEVMASLPSAWSQLFAKHSVCTMANVRSWLLEHPKEAGAAKEAAYLTDRALHEALVSSENVVCIRRLYLLERVGNPQLDPLRVLVVDILKDRENFKRSEVLEAAGVKKLQVNDSLYNKVVKDICMSHGNSWHLKPGAD